MTVLDAHRYFKIQVDKNAIGIGISGTPSFIPKEIDYLLYDALLSKISTKFTGNNPLQQPFESSKKRISDLEKLVKTDKDLVLLPDSDVNKLTLSDFNKDNKRMFFVSGILKFGDGKLSNVHLLSHDQIKRFIETHDNIPWIPEPVSILEDNKLIIYYDRIDMISPFKLDLTYLEYPKKIDSNDPLSEIDQIPEYMMFEVIELAANKALDNIESPRVQTHTAQVQISE